MIKLKLLNLLEWYRDHSGFVVFYPLAVWGWPHRKGGHPGGFRPSRRPLCSRPGWPRRYFPCVYLNQSPLHDRRYVVQNPRTRSHLIPHLEKKKRRNFFMFEYRSKVCRSINTITNIAINISKIDTDSDWNIT